MMDHAACIRLTALAAFLRLARANLVAKPHNRQSLCTNIWARASSRLPRQCHAASLDNFRSVFRAPVEEARLEESADAQQKDQHHKAFGLVSGACSGKLSAGLL